MLLPRFAAAIFNSEAPFFDFRTVLFTPLPSVYLIASIGDTFEAVLAAMYLDSGEHFNVVTPYLLPFVKEELAYIEENSVFVDYKTTLQQIVQQVEGERLEYVLVSESGPDHNKLFEVEARLNSNVIGRGKAHAKREAEQLAAKEALVLFGEKA